MDTSNVVSFGKFFIKDKCYLGQLEIDTQTNSILLRCNVILENDPLGVKVNLDNVDEIKGKLSNGSNVVLFGVKCIYSPIYFNSHQSFCFVCDSVLDCGDKDKKDWVFNRYECEIENGLAWSDISNIETELCSSEIKITDKNKPKTFNWFGAEVTFSTVITNELSNFPRKEDCIIAEHLLLEISSPEKRDCNYFINIRNKILSLISFAIQNNVNIISQNFIDYDIHLYDGLPHYYKFNYILSEQKRVIYKKNWYENIFLLTDLPDNDIKLPEKLNKLIPIFNLYSSLFRYRDMPIEMIFLNLVQAVETFHSRFYCNEKTSPNKYIKRINTNYAKYIKDPAYSNMLLSPKHQLKLDNDGKSTMDHVALFSRINELVFDNNSKIFYDLYGTDDTDNEIVNNIIATRNYYTHYDSKAEGKILDDEGLIIAIKILKCLLEYHVCKILGIDKSSYVRLTMENIRFELSNKPIKKAQNP